MIQKNLKKLWNKLDIAIIGAGIVGLAIAAETTKDYENVFVFEKTKSSDKKQAAETAKLFMQEFIIQKIR